MFFGGFIGSLLAIAAFLLGLNARKRINELKARVALAEREIDSLGDRIRDLGEATRTSGKSEPPPEAPPIAQSPAGTSAQPEDGEEPAAPTEPEQSAQPGSVPSIRGGGTDGTSQPPPPAAGTPQQPASGGFEEQLGTRWAVWAGGAALALGGLLLVRYTIEAGLIGPGVRIALGGLLAAAMIAGGEWLRRGDVRLNIEALPDAHIPSVLTAAGTVVAFATIYAAYALYDFIGPTAAFVLLGATGILTMLASALHGPALAGLGLAGAFVTPLLVSTTAPRFWPLVIYLIVVTTAAYALARTRAWLWLAIAALAGSVFWSLLMTADVGGTLNLENLSNTDAAMAHVVLQLALAAGFLAYDPNLGRRDDRSTPDLVAFGCLLATTFAAFTFLSVVSFDYWGWLATATLSIAVLTAAGWLTAAAAAATVFAGLVALVALAVWPGLYMPPDISLLSAEAARLLRLPDNVAQYLLASTLWTVPPAAVAGYRIWRGLLLPDVTAALYALAATVPPLLALILAYLRITQFDTSISFAFGGGVLALAFAFASDRFQKADQAYSVPAYNLACGALAAAAIAGLAFALTVSLERGYLTVALALAALGTAYVSALRDIPLLRYVVTALGALVAARLAWDPRIMGADVGTMPLFNWLLIGYGVPAAAFWGAARILERHGEDLPVRLCDALAVTMTGFLAFFEIRHFMNDGDVFHRGVAHVEAGLMTITTLALSYMLAKANLARKNPVLDIAATVYGAAGIAFAAFGLALVSNPYFSGDGVSGRAVFSSLLPAYLLPGLAALVVARHTHDSRPEWYVRSAGVLAVSLIFLYVTLEVRHAFHGPLIGGWLGSDDAEQWAHSFAWLVLGIAFLAYGLWRSSLEARIASAVLIVLAAVKVTVFDLSGIGGFWRAMSFLCLGGVLIGIGLVYQKFVFARPAANPSESGTG